MQFNPKISSAYTAVVLIWSTTPLAIVWSSASMHPILAVAIRMLIALIIGFVLIRLLRIPMPFNKISLRLYSYSAIGVFGGMAFSYLATWYIKSGLISLIFGLAPILSGLAGQKILSEKPFSAIRWLALIICLVGLGIIFKDALTTDNHTWLGIVCVLIAVSLFSISGVMVKTVIISIHPMATTIGALLLSVPLFFVLWLIMGAQIDINQWQAKSLYAIIYLGIFGSLVGFICYYYVLQKLNASSVALVTLITPVVALILGNQLNNEPISVYLMLGAIAILAGLSLYLWGDKLLRLSQINTKPL
ncbi:DMT family transporter [Catenovulum sp. 2E275]|uniref:DMT family transporter n=1 Tax=Catenovulum sp. 2E275 TaxID=2980497 RepID=UPI0021CE3FDE|nr:DMT family transporter [Catenovulum sp. 2E275]MCU4676090.1 DMT family transporter [Catenovulum sp. 2E275]